MSLLEETYRKVDPDGVVNMSFVNTETKETMNGKKTVMGKEKNGKNPLDACV